MSSNEAAAFEFEEPDWKERLEWHLARFKTPTVPQRFATPEQVRLVAEEQAFDETMKDWRRFHAKEQKPASAYDAMVALAILDIMPPRSLIGNIERTSACFKEQYDDHMWLTMSQRAWRIIAVEDKTMLLESFGEQTQIDLSRAKWAKYVEKASEALEALMKKEGPSNASTTDPL